MKNLVIFALIVSIINGCSILGVKPERAEKVAKYVRGYTCDLAPAARVLIREELKANGIILKVDCDLRGRDVEAW